MTKRDCAQYCTAEEPFECQNYLVVDIGGGTVDIVAYQVKEDSEQHIEVLREPSGGPWGGAMVNAEFRKYLSGLAEDIGFSRYIQTGMQGTDVSHKSSLDEICHESFEVQKIIFGNNKITKKGKASVQLTASFLNCYKGAINRQVEIIKTTEEKPYTTFSLDTGQLRVTYSTMKHLFEPILNEITKCITDVLKYVPKVHTIYLVGGFGGCEYIHLNLKSHFNNEYKFITPREKEYAVVRGAAMMRKNPEIIKARRVDATYGVGVSIPFVPQIHDKEYRCEIPGKRDRCSNIFATFVEKGDVVSPGYVYMKTFYPEREDQKFMRVHIYSSPEKDVWYTTGKRPSHARNGGAWCEVEKIGELVVPFHKKTTDTDDRAVDVMFDFSTAEIKVTGCYHNSTKTFRLVLDFLEA